MRNFSKEERLSPRKPQWATLKHLKKLAKAQMEIGSRKQEL